MTPEQWQRIQLLVEQALAQPRAARNAFVESACGIDHKLRDEVNELLAVPERETTDAELPTTWLAPFGGLGTQSFVSGERVAGRYVIRRLRGRGGMGEVYEAHDEELGTGVALKALRPDLAGDRRWLRSFKREVLLARAITNPHVCRVYDVGRHEEQGSEVWFLTMELLNGETLQERLSRQGRMPVAAALPLVEQMAAGLGAAHRSGVIHLDFKSGNVMLVKEDDGERAVITDFGLARTAIPSAEEEQEEDARTGLVGTPAYMAPEQVCGDQAGPAADIYAMGVVLYEMMTGSLPFSGQTAEEVARRRLTEDPRPPRSVVGDLDERWQEVILRCMSRKPGDRFWRAQEVAEALSGRATSFVSDILGASRVRHSLPVEQDAFVGREVELEDLERRLASGSRLVTLLGAAGMGKTRLAVRYGWQSLKSWPGGVWFSDLTEANSPDGVASAVARSLDVPLGKGDPVEQLGHAIAGRGRCLVVLDNFEQVVEHAEETLGRWMKRENEARFVVTSRERLNLRGEEVRAVEPLGAESGLELFVERTRRLRPGFEVQGSELASVQEVVRSVEAIPLAIELAAARMRVITARELADRMRERFRILARAGSGRHATLEAAIDGSWELLRPWEKAAWTQCAVFEGGFTLEAAEGVLDLGTWPEAPWVVDVVQSLVDKSLLRTWVPENTEATGVPEARFVMFASLQAYALGKLKEEGTVHGTASGAGETLTAEDRHGRWFASYGTDEALEAMDRHGGVERRWRLLRELDNLLAACRRAVTRGDGGTAAAAYQAAWAALEMRGPFLTAVNLGHEVLKAPLSRQQRGRVLTILGQAEWRSGRMDAAREHYGTALAIHREIGDRRSEGMAISGIGILDAEQGRMDEACIHYEAALAIHREVGDRHLEGRVLSSLGNLDREQGHLESAKIDFDAALAIHRELGNRRLEGLVLGNLAIVHFEQGRVDEAHAHYEAALANHREIGDRGFEGTVLGNLAVLHLEQGRADEARAHYEAALAIHRELGHRRYEGVVLGNLGYMHFQQGQIDEAQAHYEAALAIHREIGDRRSEAFALGNLGDLHRKEGRKDEGRLHLEAALAICREFGQLQLEGRVLSSIGNLYHEQGQMEEARHNYEAALVIHRETGDRRNEGMVLSNLGDLYRDQGCMDEAQAEYMAALAIHRETGDRRLEGIVLANLTNLPGPETHNR